jgi:hypothetical protein
MEESFLVRKATGKGIVHLHHLAGVMDAQPGARLGLVGFQFGADHIRQADQDDVDVRFLAQEVQRGPDGDMGTVIAPHGVNGDCDFSHGRSAWPREGARPRAALPVAEKDQLLSALVLTTLRPR